MESRKLPNASMAVLVQALHPLQRRTTYKVSFLGGRVPLDLGFRGPSEAKSFVRGRKIEPPGAPGRVFDLKCASCGHVRRCSSHKHKGIFSGNGVRRFTGGSRPPGRLPRLISDRFRPFFYDPESRGQNPLSAAVKSTLPGPREGSSILNVDPVAQTL